MRQVLGSITKINKIIKLIRIQTHKGYNGEVVI